MLKIKRGDTLELYGQLLDDGQPVDMTGWQVDCWVRDGKGRIVHKFVAVLTNPPAGRYTLTASSATTRGWQEGPLETDVRYQDGGGFVMHTCTLPLLVTNAVTVP